MFFWELAVILVRTVLLRPEFFELTLAFESDFMWSQFRYRANKIALESLVIDNLKALSVHLTHTLYDADMD